MGLQWGVLWLWLQWWLLKLLVLVCMTVAAGAAGTVIHGVLLYFRLRSSHRFTDCVNRRACLLLPAFTMFTLLLMTQLAEVPWEQLGTMAVLVATMPAVITWLGPSDEHVQACNLCQIGKGSAYSHFFGYLRLMQGKHGTKRRLEEFKASNSAGLSEDVLARFFTEAVVVLAPTNGEYPSKWDELKGVGKRVAQMPPFECSVGGNRRTYGGFDVHEVTSSGGSGTRYVALDKVGALATLRNLHLHGPAGLSAADCKKQMKELMEELERIVANNSYLRGQLKMVMYGIDEHVGDAILTAIES